MLVGPGWESPLTVAAPPRLPCSGGHTAVKHSSCAKAGEAAGISRPPDPFTSHCEPRVLGEKKPRSPNSSEEIELPRPDSPDLIDH